MERIVLAYSGGLHTSVAIPWLRERYRAEVITVTLDVGQGRDLAEIRDRAIALGAARAHVIDAREEFLRDFLRPAFIAGALDADHYSPAAALIAPLVARTLARMARIERASTVAHGATRAIGEARVGAAVEACEPALRVLAPGRVWTERQRAVNFAQARGISVRTASRAGEDVRANLWGRVVRGGVLDDPWLEPPEELYTLTRAPAECPDAPAHVALEFRGGVPVRVNAVDMPLIEMIESLETIAGAHGVGRIDAISSDPGRSGVRELYEAPAAVVLCAAREEIEKLALDPRLISVRRELSRSCSDLVYNGNWFSEAHDAVFGSTAAVQDRIAGSVRLRLFKGSCQVVGRKSFETAGQLTDVASMVGQVRRRS